MKTVNTEAATNPLNCKTGSAWHTWQIAGRAWREENTNADRNDAERAALDFADIPGWPDIGVNARYRAFMETALKHAKKINCK